MGEKTKFTFLLIVLVGFSIFEIGYVLFQLRTFILQKNIKVKVLPYGFGKFSAFFSIIVGLVMIHTFNIQDSFIYNDAADVAHTSLTISYKAWHFVYNSGIFAGSAMIINSFLTLFSRFAIDPDYVITSNGKKISKEKCMIAKNGNIMTITHRPDAPALPTVLVKFDTTTTAGKAAVDVLNDSYPKI